MPRIAKVAFSLLLVALTAPPSMGADSPAIAALKDKGLTRSGRFFVIEAEKAVLENWASSRRVVAHCLETAQRVDEAERAARERAQLEARRAEVQEMINQMNQQINEQSMQLQANNRPGGLGQGAFASSQLITQRNMVRMNLAEIDEMLNPLKANVGPDRKALESESAKSLEAAKQVLAEFRKSVDAATRQYDELNGDASVKFAMAALEKDKVGAFKLGPSTAFKNAVKALENAERTVLAKKTSTTVSRKKSKLRK